MQTFSNVIFNDTMSPLLTPHAFRLSLVFPFLFISLLNALYRFTALSPNALLSFTEYSHLEETIHAGTWDVRIVCT